MPYMPFNYNEINMAVGSYSPNMVKYANNRTFAFWQRSLFQRACSVLKFELPEEWKGSTEDFFKYCLYVYGFVVISEDPLHGRYFQPCTLSGFGFYYQPTNALIANPTIESRNLVIGRDCELLKLTPDYYGVFDIINYYAEKLATLDNAINMSIINSKFAFALFAKNKAAALAFEKLMDKINRGEPAVILDKLPNDPTSKDEPYQFIDFGNLREKYITNDLLMDLQTILNDFDTEIGIPVLPYQKKERMVTSEAESKIIDATSRSIVWFETLKSSIDNIKKLYPDIVLDVQMRYSNNMEEVQTDETNIDRNE